MAITHARRYKRGEYEAWLHVITNPDEDLITVERVEFDKELEQRFAHRKWNMSDNVTIGVVMAYEEWHSWLEDQGYTLTYERIL